MVLVERALDERRLGLVRQVDQEFRVELLEDLQRGFDQRFIVLAEFRGHRVDSLDDFRLELRIQHCLEVAVLLEDLPDSTHLEEVPILVVEEVADPDIEHVVVRPEAVA